MNFRETFWFEKPRELFLLFEYLLWLLVDPSKFKRIDNSQIKKVLIIHLGALGELLITTPLISSLQKKLDCKITAMVKKEMEKGLKNNPHVSEIIIYKDSFNENLNNLKNKNFDLAVIVNPASFKMGILCWKAGIKYRIGGFTGLKRFPAILFTRRALHISKKHSLEHCLDIIRKIGIETTNPKIEFYFSKNALTTANQKLKKLKIKDYIIVHPGFGKDEYPSRLWPSERYARVIDSLTGKYNFFVLLTGTLEEKTIIESVYNKLKNKKKVKITPGMFSLEEIGVVLSKARLLIAPSTSVVHIASSFNVPIVNLIPKKRDLYEWRPWMKKEDYRVLFSSKTKFNPNVPAEFANEGLLEITPEEVIKTAETLLKKKMQR